MSNKRKHVTLSLEDKCVILDRLEKGESIVQLAKEFNVGRATIFDIRKNAKKIRDFVSVQGGASKRQTLRVSGFPLIDEAVYMWLVQQRHAPISGELLKGKAKFFQEKIHPELTGKFKASDGWLSNFKKRHGIRCLSDGGHKSSVADAAEPLPAELYKKFAELIELNRSPVYSEFQLTDDDIIVKVLNKSANNDEEEMNLEDEHLLTHVDAVSAFNRCIEWAKQNDINHSQVLLLRQMRKKAVEKMLTCKKQKKITDYFVTA